MRTLRTVSELRAALAEHRRAGATVGLVPTMGAFHEGHLSLMRRAREENDVVVVSLFVNPTQFNEQTDLERYPRDEAADAELARELEVDYLFAPETSEVYPDGFDTTVHVGAVTGRLEGTYRGPGHFDGVATVVTKLFNMVAPDVAYFGQKDAQQTLVIRQLVRDLNLPVRVEVCPTVREADGLALSSRNALLSPEERLRALSLHRTLRLAQEAVDGGERHGTTIRARALAELTAAGLEPEYFELVDPETMAPVQHIEGDVLAVVAARVGVTRLIDNDTIHNGRPSRT
jgi:pantoate--beta-alanine ligase